MYARAKPIFIRQDRTDKNYAQILSGFVRFIFSMQSLTKAQSCDKVFQSVNRSNDLEADR